jgi:ABC transport system ATP-binding/permease protein
LLPPEHSSIQPVLRLGREPDNDLVLPDSLTSRHHALLQRQGSTVQIVDLNSSNGTFVNGQRIPHPTPLKNGDILLIGDTRLAIRA